MDHQGTARFHSPFPWLRSYGIVEIVDLLTMKTLIQSYVRQPSTWLGLAKMGAAFGLYSTGVGGALTTAIVSIFGVIDVIRNERR
jgi:hypothetical protein